MWWIVMALGPESSILRLSDNKPLELAASPSAGDSRLGETVLQWAIRGPSFLASPANLCVYHRALGFAIINLFYMQQRPCVRCQRVLSPAIRYNSMITCSQQNYIW